MDMVIDFPQLVGRPLGKLFTRIIALSPISIMWYRDKEWWRTAAGKVTAGQVESTGSCRQVVHVCTRLLTSFVGCRPKHGRSAPALRSLAIMELCLNPYLNVFIIKTLVQIQIKIVFQ